jgi:Zn-dependent protease/CBS domain-containing protein
VDGGVKLGRVLGIPFAVHHTWLIAFGLVAWSLAVGLFPERYAGWTPGTYWLVGLVAALLLFVSVLVHELAHALVAQGRGLSVRGITLFVFGGVAEIEGEAERPLDEFLIAVVGPLTSGAIGGLAWLASGMVAETNGIAHAILNYLAVSNGILAAFNMVPGYPLDGGRILRAIVWAISGSLPTATKAASYVGQAFAYGLIALGVLRMFGGDFLGGMWTAFIGWFLNGAAEASRRQLAFQAGFRGVRVRDLMTPDPHVVPPTMPLDSFVREEVVRRGHQAAPVLDGERLVGIVSIADARKVDGDAWPTTPVSAVMTAENLAVVAPGDPVERGLKLMAERDLHQLLVVDGGRLVGLLTRGGLVRFVALREQFGLAAHPAPGGRTTEPGLRHAA